jgi:hypothetical protein
MRGDRGIVNEMEFRMLREARSFSPSPHTRTIKRFSCSHRAPTPSRLCQQNNRRALCTGARIVFSCARLGENVIVRDARNSVGHFIDGRSRTHRLGGRKRIEPTEHSEMSGPRFTAGPLHLAAIVLLHAACMAALVWLSL